MKKYIPLLLACLSVIGYGFYTYRTSVTQNDGLFIYGLDDAYIHMAIARNFAEYGVWGVTRYAFSSTTSSVLWTLILALCFKVLGVLTLLPLILNVLFACLALWVADAMLRGPVSSPFYRFLALEFFLVVTPFPPLITTGMEHSLQILITLAFCWWSVRALAGENPSPAAGAAPLMYLSALFMAFVRYECAFIALIVCFMLLFRGRLFQAIALGLTVLVPVVVYGWISVQHGWLFFPNALLLKSGMLNSDPGGFIANAFSRGGFFYWRLLQNPHLLFLLMLAVGLYALRAASVDVWDERQNLLLIFVFGTILHMQFARPGWFYRYEAYLMALGLVATTAAIAEFAPLLREATAKDPRTAARVVSIYAFAILMIIPAFDRGITAFGRAPMAMNDRYFEHYIPSMFIKRYYPQDSIMVNDIGAPCFFTDAHIFDIYGLGDMEPARFRMSVDGYTKADALEWARRENVKIAIIQVEWGVVADVVPDEWIKVGEWKIPRNVVFGDKRIGWYATSEAEAQRLMANLTEFAPNVPAIVAQSGRYRGDEPGGASESALDDGATVERDGVDDATQPARN